MFPIQPPFSDNKGNEDNACSWNSCWKFAEVTVFRELGDPDKPWVIFSWGDLLIHYHLKIALIRVNGEYSSVRKCEAKVGSQLWQLASTAGKNLIEMETSFLLPDDGKATSRQCQLFGYFFLQMPCNTPVLLPLLVCILCIKNCYLFGHYLLCLTEGHPKKAPWSQHTPLSQTLIGECFHQVLKRNSPGTARWQRFQRRIVGWSCKNELPCSTRSWSQLVTPRTPQTSFSCDHVGAIIAAGKYHALKRSYSD